jgi:hypothetical protein
MSEIVNLHPAVAGQRDGACRLDSGNNGNGVVRCRAGVSVLGDVVSISEDRGNSCLEAEN